MHSNDHLRGCGRSHGVAAGAAGSADEDAAAAEPETEDNIASGAEAEIIEDDDEAAQNQKN